MKSSRKIKEAYALMKRVTEGRRAWRIRLALVTNWEKQFLAKGGQHDVN
jgi:hypothetical protein